VNDARSFLRTTPSHYDLIVYGLLDSHTLLSQASSVRLDSFVYTVEGCAKQGRAETERRTVPLIQRPERCSWDQNLPEMKQAFDGKERSASFPHTRRQVFMQSKNGDLSIPPACSGKLTLLSGLNSIETQPSR